MPRHQTPDEIALNQQEFTCRVELEKLEVQEAQLENELEQDADESHKSLTLYTLKIEYEELLAKHQEFARIKDAQITSIQRCLRAYGGTEALICKCPPSEGAKIMVEPENNIVLINERLGDLATHLADIVARLNDMAVHINHIETGIDNILNRNNSLKEASGLTIDDAMIYDATPSIEDEKPD